MFTPVHTTKLRMPSVPLITVDPYVSYWCRFDHLYDSETEHWSERKKPMLGLLRVDGQTYRVMGQHRDQVVPLADEKAWSGQYTTTKPANDSWVNLSFDDSSWKTGAAPYGGGDDYYKTVCKTAWSGGNTDIYVRRKFTLDEIDDKAVYSVNFKHDDVFELYLNGKKVASRGNSWNTSGVTVDIDKSILVKGENILAAHCHNTEGGAFLDFGLVKSALNSAATQVGKAQVLATNTYYKFTCGPVDLTLVFTAPFIMDDLVLFSTPINYISYQVTPNDGQEHQVEFLFEGSPRIASRNYATVRTIIKPTSTAANKAPSLQLLKTGNATQDCLRGTGDSDNNIDWGYFYMAKPKDDVHKKMSIEPHSVAIQKFMENGQFETETIRTYSSLTATDDKTITIIDSMGVVGADGYRSFLMVGYDDTQSIEYHGDRRKGYWSNNGKTLIEARFEDMYVNYENIMTRCREVDEQIYTDAYECDGEKYAELLSGVYRQANAAHKLIQDKWGNLLFFSRENNSGGFINTMDVTYPSQPLYFLYNPALAKAMITSCIEYSVHSEANTEKWGWIYTSKFGANAGKVLPFCNHDLGGYPKANGQTYGSRDDHSTLMPVEESGNALCLLAVITYLDQDYAYLNKYWKYLKMWADYLVEYGKDPTNQLCTDDFMGHSDRNSNLAAKACMGVRSFAEMAGMLGLDDVKAEYIAKAEDMAAYWKANSKVGSSSTLHYTRGFKGDAKQWSMKYNLVWDRAWNWNMFSDVRLSELKFYKTKRKTYGLGLDERDENLIKNDWHLWMAGMCDVGSGITATDRKWYFDTMWKFANECPTRQPLTDCHDGNNASKRLFFARSVVGGYWMPIFVKKFSTGQMDPTSIIAPKDDINKSYGPFNNFWYDLSGRQVEEPTTGNVYIHNGKKVLK